MCEQIINDALKPNGPQKFLQARTHSCTHTHTLTLKLVLSPGSWLAASLCLQPWEKEKRRIIAVVEPCTAASGTLSLTHLLLPPTPLQPPSSPLPSLSSLTCIPSVQDSQLFLLTLQLLQLPHRTLPSSLFPAPPSSLNKNHTVPPPNFFLTFFPPFLPAPCFRSPSGEPRTEFLSQWRYFHTLMSHKLWPVFCDAQNWCDSGIKQLFPVV